ncbi:MAG: diacylglycerol kinase family lipid kinase [Pisciglobus halotolerans]|nr:diacylglycerol kinase family lipid kinase [Pisciglobus halotolerans]
MEKVLIVVNPSSGEEKAEEYVDQLQEVMEEMGNEIIIFKTEKQTKPDNIAKLIQQKAVDWLISLGGDGTVNMCANAVMESKKDVALGIIPLGTVNNFARMLGISMVPKQAINQLKEAKIRKVDIGTTGKGYFISSFSVGPLPATVQQVTSEQKEKLGPLAYLVEGAKALGAEETYNFHLEADQEKVEKEYGLLLVTLSNTVLGIESFFPEAAPNDGKLEFFGLTKTSLGQKVGVMMQVLRGEIDQSDYVDVTKCNTLSIDFDEKAGIRATVDGDEGPSFPITIEVLPEGLSVLVPADEEK